MLGFLKIYFLFNLHFILIKCLIPDIASLSVRKLDKKIIERKRQDTRDMCRIFNAETQNGKIFTDTKVHIVPSKYDKRKQEIKRNTKELERHLRIKRDAGTMFAVNPAMKAEDEERVEKLVDGIYDDLLEKGQRINYRRRELVKTGVNSNIPAANKTSGRRFPFAPQLIGAPTTTRAPSDVPGDSLNKTMRFKHAIVPYFIDSKTYDTHLSEIIMKAFEYVEKATCIRLQRLRERPTDKMSLQNIVWLYITNPSGIQQCVHSNERAQIKGVQMIVFGYDCMSLGDITHEIMHILGFAHEHVRPDRDQYITILWDNIKPGYRKYFEVHHNPIIANLPYDYDSVLHYPPRAFSRNGQVTIMTKPGIKIGQREGLSEIDVEKIGMAYSNECVKRNREYLLKTCPSVVKSSPPPANTTQDEIDDYFEDRLWPYGVVNYRLRDRMEFSSEEVENIKAVIRHIEKETCIEFREITEDPAAKASSTEDSSSEFSGSKPDSFVVLENGTKPELPPTTSEESGKVVEFENNSIDKFEATSGEKGYDTDNFIEEPFGPRTTITQQSNFTHPKSMLANKSGTTSKSANPKGTPKPADPTATSKSTDPRAPSKSADARVRSKRASQTLPSPSRRHANSILVLSRSPLPGCMCPHPGKPEGTHVLKINTDCFNSVNDLLHMFVHVLGLDHQHNMHDRDSYLHIVWDQLTEDVRTEMKNKLPPAASVGFQYDYQSVMHYPWLQIKNGRTNIMYPIWNDGWAMGHWQGLSSSDVQKLNLLYFKQCLARKQQAEEDGKDMRFKSIN